VSVAAGLAAGAVRRYRAGRRFRTSPAIVVSGSVIVAATVVAVAGPLLAPYNPDLPQLSQYFFGPSPPGAT